MGNNLRMSDSAPLYALLIVLAVVAGVVIAVVAAVHWTVVERAIGRCVPDAYRKE